MLETNRLDCFLARLFGKKVVGRDEGNRYDYDTVIEMRRWRGRLYITSITQTPPTNLTARTAID